MTMSTPDQYGGAVYVRSEVRSSGPRGISVRNLARNRQIVYNPFLPTKLEIT